MNEVIAMTLNENPKKKVNKFSLGEKVAKVSILSMIALTIIKGLVGFYYGSVALIADAINSFSDIFASALILSGLSLAQRDPNEKFPYGYYRGETLASLLVSIMIIVSGIEIVWESANKILNPIPISEGLLPLIAAATSAVTYYILARYKRSVGLKIGSNGLIADSKHSIVDVYAGVLVFISIIFSVAGLAIVEVGVAVAIGLYIIKEGYILTKDSALSLMDAAPYTENLDEIKEIARKVPGVADVHDIRIRRAGPVCFAEMHVSIASGTSIDQAHQLSHRIESELATILPDLESVTIHIEPTEKTVKKIAIPVDSTDASLCRTVTHFARSPAFCIVKITTGEISDIHCIQNPGSTAEKKRGVLAADALSNEGVNMLVAVDIGRGPYDILTGRLISIYKLPSKPLTVQQVATMCANNELERYEPPQS